MDETCHMPFGSGRGSLKTIVLAAVHVQRMKRGFTARRFLPVMCSFRTAYVQ
ncbi:MAG: hypothetical protein JWP03_853 [Phycisphaerales bacterium]|jgi:hypothetical protein|nr:hypothetical protein [Phycisphaerales bacterium]